MHVVDLDRDVPLDTGPREPAVDLVAGAPVRVEVHEGLTGQLVERDGLPSGERAFRRAREHQRFRGQSGHPHVVGRLRLAGDERDVEVPSADLLDELAAPGLAHADLDAGVLLVEPRQHGGQVHHVQALERADGQRAAQQALHGGDRVARRLDRAERAPRLGQQRAAGLGQLDLAGGAQEERCAQFDLERSDGRRQTRLGDVHPARGTREMALLGDRDEVFELAKFHIHHP